jgi:DedD protein
MGAVFLISAGFMLGLVVGVVKEEPELVMGHLSGQSEEIRWSEQETEQGMPDVSARGPLLDEAEEPPVNRPWADDTIALDPPIAIVAAAEDRASRGYEAPQPRLISSLPAPAKAAPKITRSVQSRGYSVQVGAFSESSAADRVLDDLRSKGFSVYITPSAGSRDGRWRVRVGPMDTRAEALEVAQQLKTQERLPTWVLSEGGN